MSSSRVGLAVIDEVNYKHIIPGVWSRGGFSDVRVCHDHCEYCIPENVLWDLFAEEFKRRQISKLEQMDTEDVRALVGVSDVKGK